MTVSLIWVEVRAGELGSGLPELGFAHCPLREEHTPIPHSRFDTPRVPLMVS